MLKGKTLSDTVKAVALTNAALSANFAASGEVGFAVLTGTLAAVGISVDYAAQKLAKRT